MLRPADRADFNALGTGGNRCVTPVVDEDEVAGGGNVDGGLDGGLGGGPAPAIVGVVAGGGVDVEVSVGREDADGRPAGMEGREGAVIDGSGGDLRAGASCAGEPAVEGIAVAGVRDGEIADGLADNESQGSGGPVAEVHRDRLECGDGVEPGGIGLDHGVLVEDDHRRGGDPRALGDISTDLDAVGDVPFAAVRCVVRRQEAGGGAGGEVVRRRRVPVADVPREDAVIRPDEGIDEPFGSWERVRRLAARPAVKPHVDVLAEGDFAQFQRAPVEIRVHRQVDEHLLRRRRRVGLVFEVDGVRHPLARSHVPLLAKPAWTGHLVGIPALAGKTHHVFI